MSMFICSDLHINEAKRFKDTRFILHKIIEQVKSCTPTYLTVTGDIFDKRKPTPLEMQCFNKWLMSVRDYVIDSVILLEGNHDQDRDISSLSYLSDLNINKVKVVDPPYIFKTEQGLKFYFGHEQINGAVTSSNIKLSGGVSIGSLTEDNPDVDIFAFGHFHKSQVLQKDPLIFYVGSINNLTFAERLDTKVTWFFDNKGKIHTLSLPTRKMYQFDIAVYKDNDGSAPWKDTNLADSMVKIVYTGTKEALKQIDKDEVKKLKIEKDLFSLKVEYNVISKSISRNPKVTESVKEEVALREYFKDKEMDLIEKEKIIDAGLKLISEVNSNG